MALLISPKKDLIQNNDITLLQLPDCVLEEIFEYLSYDEISKKRLVCRRINRICQSLLNRGFNKMVKRHSKELREIKAQLPRRESERRNHPLARHADILTCIETRISMLSMTYSKYMEMNLCCFIPGKVIDEVLRVLGLLHSAEKPLRAHEVLQELRDISSMAIEHFDEKIANMLKKYISEVTHRARQQSASRRYPSHSFLKKCSPSPDGKGLESQNYTAIDESNDIHLIHKQKYPDYLLALSPTSPPHSYMSAIPSTSGLTREVPRFCIHATSPGSVVYSNAATAASEILKSGSIGFSQEELVDETNTSPLNKDNRNQSEYISASFLPTAPINCEDAKQNRQLILILKQKYNQAIKKFNRLVQINRRQSVQLRHNIATISEMKTQMGDLKKRVEETDARNREILENISQLSEDSNSSSPVKSPVKDETHPIKRRTATSILKRRITEPIRRADMPNVSTFNPVSVDIDNFLKGPENTENELDVLEFPSPEKEIPDYEEPMKRPKLE